MEPKQNKKHNHTPANQTGKAPLPPAVMETLKKAKDIISIVCCGNKLTFIFKDGHKESHRIKLEHLPLWPYSKIFLRIHRSWAINMHCMLSETHNEKTGSIKLIDNESYSVSASYIDNFVCCLALLYKNQRIRERKENFRHKWLFSSKFDI